MVMVGRGPSESAQAFCGLDPDLALPQSTPLWCQSRSASGACGLCEGCQEVCLEAGHEAGPSQRLLRPLSSLPSSGRPVPLVTYRVSSCRVSGFHRVPEWGGGSTRDGVLPSDPVTAAKGHGAGSGTQRP